MSNGILLMITKDELIEILKDSASEIINFQKGIRDRGSERVTKQADYSKPDFVKNDRFITKHEMMSVLGYKRAAYNKWKKQCGFPVWKLHRDNEVAERKDFYDWVLSKRLG